MNNAALLATGISNPRAIRVVGDSIYVAGSDNGEPVIAEYSTSLKALKRRYALQSRQSALTVQSLIAVSSGLLYVGGYQGDGIASVNPDTGERWQGPAVPGKL